jgi:hypothetical protein
LIITLGRCTASLRRWAAGNRALDTEGEIRRHLQAHVAVAPLRALVHGAQHIGRELHVDDHQCFAQTGFVDRVILLEQLAYGLVIVAAGADRLVKDRRVGRDAGEPAVHQAL